MIRQLFITCALPYANGPLHLGHLVEFIQADVWVRFQTMRGHHCTFVSGDDAHGTAIMLKADALAITPQAHIDQCHQAHQQDLKDFDIGLDIFHTTHCEENRRLSENLFTKINAQGDIEARQIEQAFDAEKNLFLPDRYIKGTCPKCHADNQYGDNCDACGTTYQAHELKNPKSTLSNTTPITKQTEHLFFRLSKYQAWLKNWIDTHCPQPEIIHKLQEWLEQGLTDWDITRDPPYFGFKIPGRDQYFYVWLDAPIGYMASLDKLSQSKSELSVERVWQANSPVEVYHFIGKDIVYFHTLFWPAMLKSAGMRTPTSVFVHGFLTINGQKMSKSRGTFITARSYLKYLDAEHLRYYVAAKLSSRVEDIDLQFNDFKQRVNADLVGKIVNIASRCAGFIHKNFKSKLAGTLHQAALFESSQAQASVIADYYETRQTSKAVRLIAELADHANQYINDMAPWKVIKDQDKLSEVHQVCTTGLNLFRLLMIYVSPILPKMSNDAAQFFQSKPFCWQDLDTPLLNHNIGPFKPLTQRVEQESIDALMADPVADHSQTTKEPIMTNTNHHNDGIITIQDFSKVDLRVAIITQAEHVEGSHALLQLQLDVGDHQKQVFAGIKKHYAPEDLIHKKVIVVDNLQPRKMRFGVSEGMILVTKFSEQEELFLLEPNINAKPGMRVG